MRRIVVTEFVSLDGVFEDPGGSEGTALTRLDSGTVILTDHRR